jgi:hypothetical protein
MTHRFMLAAIAAQGQVRVLDDQLFARWRDYVRPQAREEC